MPGFAASQGLAFALEGDAKLQPGGSTRPVRTGSVRLATQVGAVLQEPGVIRHPQPQATFIGVVALALAWVQGAAEGWIQAGGRAQALGLAEKLGSWPPRSSRPTSNGLEAVGRSEQAPALKVPGLRVFLPPKRNPR